MTAVVVAVVPVVAVALTPGAVTDDVPTVVVVATVVVVDAAFFLPPPPHAPNAIVRTRTRRGRQNRPLLITLISCLQGYEVDRARSFIHDRCQRRGLELATDERTRYWAIGLWFVKRDSRVDQLVGDGLRR